MNSQKIEALLRFLIEQAPLDEETRSYFGFDILMPKLPDRDKAYLFLASLISPPDPPDREALGYHLLRQLAERSVIDGREVERQYPSNILRDLVRLTLISKSISGYRLTALGAQKYAELRDEKAKETDRGNDGSRDSSAGQGDSGTGGHDAPPAES